MQQDNKQKQANQLAILFLSIILIYLLLTLCIGILASKNIYLPTSLSLIVSELVILIPGLIYIVINKLSIREDLGFNRIKIGTFFMTLLITVLVTPVVMFVNLLSQLFVSNTVTQASDALFNGSSILLILILSSFYGPFCEELMFRSIINNGYERLDRGIKYALISAMLFGLMHMNVNQACYAFVLGLIFAIVNRASGSVWTSIIMHVAINLSNMIMLALSYTLLSSNGANLSQAAEAARNDSGMMYYMIAIYFVLAIVCGALAIPCIVFVSKHEGRYDKLIELFTRKSKKIDVEEDLVNTQKTRLVLNVPMIIALVICFFVMFGLTPLLQALGFNY